MVCTLEGINDVTGYKLNFARVFAVDTDGGNVKLVTYGNDIIDWLPDDPSRILVFSRSMYKIDVNTGARTYVGGDDAMTGTIGTDAHGNVRLKTSAGTPAFAARLGSNYWYARAPGRREWIKVASVDLDARVRTRVLGFDETGDDILALMPRDGRLALMRIAIRPGAVPQTVFAHPEVDIDDVLRIGKYNRPVAAVFTTDARGYEYFDPELKRLSAALAKALPGHPTVNILDESWDGSKKLIEASSDTDAGHFYLYDRTTHNLGTIATTRPALDGVTLATVEPITYAARDGTKIPGFVTWPAR